ncbi:hypothetical protein [Streptomyces sp. NPDC003077]|uniref:hypothetical protein n=1 Tax=Streptomyces sp. NPDC003077 TaxID=3154443 RepID=UPI0033AA1650
MAEAELPDWTDQKMGTMVRAALWLVSEVGEGNVFTREQLRAAFPDVAQIDRRVRDLRELGWQIATNRDDALLRPHESRFVRTGEPVWEPGVRRTPRVQRRRSGVAEMRMRAPERILQEPDPEAAWERVEKLSPNEQALLLAWIAMDRRPSSPAELAWRAYRSLPDRQRHELAAKLGAVVSAELSDEPPVLEQSGDE